MYNENFTKLVTESADSTYIGRGNPNAKILLVGQEYSKPNKNEEFNAKYWRSKIVNNEAVCLTHDKKVSEGHTWTKYQKLHDYIFERDNTKKIDFEEKIFTTEMNDNPAKNNAEAQKREDFEINLQNRKKTFINSEFIKNFPIVVLACSHYISPNEFCEIFEVEFHPLGRKYPNDDSNAMTNHYWTHYNKKESDPKLVIHTQQLSGHISNDLLKQMGKDIRDFLQTNNYWELSNH